MMARWFRDVLPHHVAEAQFYWDLVQECDRMRKVARMNYEHKMRLAIMPPEQFYDAINARSPIERYLNGEHLCNEPDKTSVNLHDEIERILNDPARLRDAVERARPALDGLKRIKERAYHRRMEEQR